MNLPSGTRLGPYEIDAPIGAGGMGAVFRARDTRLERTVAIKVLPSELAANAQFRLRFEREAKSISSLNHPNICTLFDVGNSDIVGVSGPETIHYLVMEHIEGETLADRLSRGPLPLDEVIRRGAEIADALDRAHRHGIVHRDLKPGNVMLTRSGIKLLDFGLARHEEHALLPEADEQLTAQKPLTQEGTILGTWHYMAPEQLEGLPADERSDIFAFGCLLYEMATGRRAFEGRSRTSIIAAIISSEPPPVSQIQPLAPPALQQIISKAIEKDPEERWQSIRDVRSALQWIAEAGSQAGVSKAVVSARRTSRRTLVGLAFAGWLLAIAGAAWIAVSRSDGGRAIPFRSDLVALPDQPLATVVTGAVALSPDGSRLLMTSSASAGSSRVVVREFAGGESRVLAGTEDASFPFWSHDGRSIAFFSEGKLKTVDANGGPVQILCDTHAGRGGSWGRGGVIIFAPDITGPLMQVSENGGTPVVVTTAAASTTHRNPFFLADGRRFLFIERESRTEAFGRIMLGSLDGGEARQVAERGSNPQVARGFLLFVRDGNLVAQRFDSKKGTAEGALVPIANGIEYYNARDLANFSVNDSGLLVYRQKSPAMTELVWYGRDGRVLDRVGEPGHYTGGRLSLDGSTVALVRSDASEMNYDVWALDLERQQMTRSTFIATSGIITAVPSADGQRLALSSFVGSGWASRAVWLQQTTGSNAPEQLIESATFMVYDWSADGKYVLGTTQEPNSGHDVAWVSVDEPNKLRPFAATRFNESSPRLSPDGAWLAWVSDESGRWEIYVSDFPEGKRKWQVSSTGARSPHWTSDGRELVMEGPEGMYSVTVEQSGGAPRFGAPVLLPISGGALDPNSSIIVGSAGDRLLILRRVRTDEQPLRLIRNWEASLSR
jgi:eukaryotic-like serine/threonine-protein kinase